MAHPSTVSPVESMPLSGFEVTVLIQIASGFPLQAVLEEKSWAARFGQNARKIAKVITCKQAKPKFSCRLLAERIPANTIQRSYRPRRTRSIEIVQVADEFLKMASAR